MCVPINSKKRLLASSFLSVSVSASITAVPTGRIFLKFDIGNFYENPSRNSRFGRNRATVSGTSHRDLSTFVLFSVESENQIIREGPNIYALPRKSREALIGLCLKVRQSVRTYQRGSQWMEFHEIWYRGQNLWLQVWLRSEKKHGALYIKTYVCFMQNLICVCPCIVDICGEEKPTRCHLKTLLFLGTAQHVSGTHMPIIRSLRLY
jgi:hypothetical protein